MVEPLTKRPKMEAVEDVTGAPSSAAVARELPATSEIVDVEAAGEGAAGMSGHEVTALRSINVSSEDFSVIVESAAFIDKTLLIGNLFKTPKEKGKMKKVLITAPQRFGKSVNMNMLKKFFEIEVDENGDPKNCVKKNEAGKWIVDEGKKPTKNFVLFKDKDLKIYKCHCSKPGHTKEQVESGECASRQFFYEHCGQHPVLFVSFKELKCYSWEGLLSSFRYVLNSVFQQHTYLRASKHLESAEREDFCDYVDVKKVRTLDEQQVCDGLEKLVYYMYKHFNRKVIILIDEFDAPIMKLIHDSEDSEDVGLRHIKQATRFIREIVSSVMKGNEHVLGGLMNACVLLSTILSGDANNIEICPFLGNHAFSEFYGFTEHEVNKLLKEPEFSGFDGATLLQYYNGYTVLRGGIKLYCVYSVVKYLANWNLQKSPDKKNYMPQNYWVQNHGIEDLNELFGIKEIRDPIQKMFNEGLYHIVQPKKKLSPRDILQLKRIVEQYSIVPFSGQEKLFLLYMKDRGYFNVIGETNFSCTLEIPNNEIVDELAGKLYDQNYYQKKYKYTSKHISDYCNALLSLDVNKPETLKGLANAIELLYTDGVPMPSNHDEFKAPLIAFAFGMQNVDVKAEMRCQQGRNFRLDLLIYRKEESTGIIIEFKWGSSQTAEEGLKQILDNQYYKAFEYFDTHHKIYIGLHFSELRKVSICAASTNSEEWAVVAKNLIRYPKSENKE